MTQTSNLQVQHQVTALLDGANQQLRDPNAVWHKPDGWTSALQPGAAVVRSVHDSVFNAAGDDDLPCGGATDRMSRHCPRLPARLGRTDQELFGEVMRNYSRQIVHLDRPRRPLS